MTMGRLAPFDSADEQRRTLDHIRSSGKPLLISLVGKRTLSPVELRFLEKATRIARSGRQKLSIHAAGAPPQSRASLSERLVDRHEIAQLLARYAKPAEAAGELIQETH